MQSLKDALEEDQPNFLKKKMETLNKIMEEEKKYDFNRLDFDQIFYYRSRNTQMLLVENLYQYHYFFQVR